MDLETLISDLKFRGERGSQNEGRSCKLQARIAEAERRYWLIGAACCGLLGLAASLALLSGLDGLALALAFSIPAGVLFYFLDDLCGLARRRILLSFPLAMLSPELQRKL